MKLFLSAFAVSAAALAGAQVPMSLYDLNNRLTPIFALDPVHVGNLEGRLADGPGSGSTPLATNFSAATVGMLRKNVAVIDGGRFLRALHGMPANGGGAYTNQYTMVFDVKMTNAAAGSYFSFFNTTADVNNDGDSFVQWFDVNGQLEGRIGIAGIYQGAYQPNTWHRIAIVVDCSAAVGNIRYYMDGMFVHQVDIGAGALDGRYAAYTWGDPDAEDHIDMFGDDDGDWFDGQVSALAFYDSLLTDAEIAGLGKLSGSAEIVEGLPFGGDVPQLYASDEDKLFILSDENTPNAELIVSQVTPYPTALSIDVITETAATRDDLSLFTSALNLSTNAYQLLGTQVSTLADTQQTFSITTNVDNYLSDINGEIKVKLRWIPQADLEAADGWSEVVDMVNFVVNVP